MGGKTRAGAHVAATARAVASCLWFDSHPNMTCFSAINKKANSVVGATLQPTKSIPPRKRAKMEKPAAAGAGACDSLSQRSTSSASGFSIAERKYHCTHDKKERLATLTGLYVDMLCTGKYDAAVINEALKTNFQKRRGTRPPSSVSPRDRAGSRRVPPGPAVLSSPTIRIPVALFPP